MSSDPKQTSDSSERVEDLEQQTDVTGQDESVKGGFNPQPDPPGREATQISKIYPGGVSLPPGPISL